MIYNSICLGALSVTTHASRHQVVIRPALQALNRHPPVQIDLLEYVIMGIDVGQFDFLEIRQRRARSEMLGNSRGPVKVGRVAGKALDAIIDGAVGMHDEFPVAGLQ